MPSFDPAVAPFIINTKANSHINGKDNSNMNANGNGNGSLNGTANEYGSIIANANANGNGNGNFNNDPNASSNGNGTSTCDGFNSPKSTSANASPSPSHSSNNSHRSGGHNSPVNRPIRRDRKNCAPTASNAQGLFPPAACVFVGNLSTRVPLEQQGKELEKKFSTIGPCYVKTNVDRKKELPSAFVQFEKSEHAETALTWHNTMQLHGRLLRVEVSKAIRTGIMGYCNGNSITLDAVREALLGRGALDYCTTECTTSGITVSKVVFSFVGDYQDAMRHFQNNPDIYLKADHGIRPIYPPSPLLPQYSQSQPSYYPPAPAPPPYTQVPYTQGSGAYPTGPYAQVPPLSPPFLTFPPFPNYTNWTYPQEQLPQHYQWSYGQGTYPPYAQGSWYPPHWSEPPCYPEPPHHIAEAPNLNTHTQTLHPEMFFPPAPWSEEHYAATASQDLGSQSAQAQPTVSQYTQPASGNELTPPSSPEKEEKKMEAEQADKKTAIDEETVPEESTEEKEKEKKEKEAGNEKKDENNWPLVVGQGFPFIF